MNVVDNLAAATALHIHHLALGFFDGVHRGHMSVISPAAGPVHDVLTFWPHPRAVLRPDEPTRLLTGWSHKAQVLAAVGVRNVIALPFTNELANTDAGEFLADLTFALPQLKGLACGPNFHFGKNRLGNPAMLGEHCKRMGWKFHMADFLLDNNEAVSSSRIRQALRGGDLQHASWLLGRAYSLRGTVVRGAGLGEKIGFPTANLQSEDDWLLPTGVYAAKAVVRGVSYPAALNAGLRPTVSDYEPRVVVEAHLPGFSGDLYERTIELIPEKFLRGEQKFDGLEALRSQIAKDVARVAAGVR